MPKNYEDRFVVNPAGIRDLGYLGKDGKIHQELPEDQRMDFSHLYPTEQKEEPEKLGE